MIATTALLKSLQMEEDHLPAYKLKFVIYQAHLKV